MTLVFTALLSEGLNSTQDHALANDRRLGRDVEGTELARNRAASVFGSSPCGVNGHNEKAGVPALPAFEHMGCATLGKSLNFLESHFPQL